MRRTMHSYRVKLTENDRAQRMFEDLTRKLATAEGVRLGRPRLDSTHVLSNIALLTRLGLFCETVEHFMRTLRKELPEAGPRPGSSASGAVARRCERDPHA